MDKIIDINFSHLNKNSKLDFFFLDFIKYSNFFVHATVKKKIVIFFCYCIFSMYHV